GLECQRYAAMVAQQLQARGFQPATSAQSANMLVQFGYGVDHGQTRIGEDPFYRSHFYSGFGWGSGFHRSRFGWGGGFGWGWNDPFWYGGGVDSYVEYHSQIDLHIRAAGSNAPLFDGRAQARSETNRLDVVVPSLVEAMFTGFPGQSGEVVRITIPSRQRPRAWLRECGKNREFFRRQVHRLPVLRDAAMEKVDGDPIHLNRLFVPVIPKLGQVSDVAVELRRLIADGSDELAIPTPAASELA